MKKFVLSTIIAAAGTAIAVAVKQGKFKPAMDKVMGIPLVAKTVEKV